jgi:hypothetical protein
VEVFKIIARVPVEGEKRMARHFLNNYSQGVKSCGLDGTGIKIVSYYRKARIFREEESVVVAASIKICVQARVLDFNQTVLFCACERT